jgi:hypothetical protein
MHVSVYSFNFNNVQYIYFLHLHAESTLFLTYKFRFKQCISITDTVLKKHWGCKLGSLRLIMLIEKVPGFLNVWLTSCGQKLDYRPITRALVLQLNVRAAVIGWCHLSCPEEVSVEFVCFTPHEHLNGLFRGIVLSRRSEPSQGMDYQVWHLLSYSIHVDMISKTLCFSRAGPRNS